MSLEKHVWETRLPYSLSASGDPLAHRSYAFVVQDGSTSSQYISSPIMHGYIYPSKISNYFFPFLLDPFRGVFVALDGTACSETAGADTGLGAGLTAGLAAP